MSLDVYLEPNKCPHCGRADEGFSAKITHNLCAMAEEAGICGIVWRPEESGITTAKQLIEPLRAAIGAMKADPARFEKHNPKNGWGSYEGFVPWLEEYLDACLAEPEAAVRASR